MFNNTGAFSSFSVDDLEKAREFYGKTLGVNVEVEGDMGIKLLLAEGTAIFVYPKKDHQPATFTILNFIVDDIDASMNELKEKGVQFMHYNIDGIEQDENGVFRGLSTGKGPDIAWFEDPAGNVLSVLQEKLSVG